MGIDLFRLDGKVAIITGGNGVLGGAMAKALASAGAKTVILGRNSETVNSRVSEINEMGYESLGIAADVMEADQLSEAKKTILDQFGTIDILINAAGGAVKGAIVNPDESFFDKPVEAHKHVVDLNLFGTIIPTQVFGEVMSKKRSGSIINIGSMAVPRSISRAIGYAASKAAAENFTRWLAVELASKYGEGLRVNTIRPGFFVGEQNRHLLLNEDGTLTERGQLIVKNTPMARFGEADELAGAAIYLASEASKFVTGEVINIDGGFNSFSGV